MTALHHVPHTKIPTLVFDTSSQATHYLAPHDREAHPPAQRRGPADRPGPAHRHHAGRPVPRTDPPAPRRGLDFSRVVTFNLDEYYPMPPDDPHSYTAGCTRRSSTTSTFRAQNIHIPDGTIPRRRGGGLLPPLRAEDPPGRRHRRAGAGHRPHRAHRLQRTRLDPQQPHAPGHARPGHAPRRGQRRSSARKTCRTRRITMGVGTILDARRRSSSWPSASTRPPIVQKAVERPMTDAVAASFPARAPRRHVPAR